MKLTFHEAQQKDLPILVQMLADDQLGAKREDASIPLDSSYLNAFDTIKNDINNGLIVVEYERNIIGMLQLTFIPYLSHKGAWRCLIEAVRVHKNYRGRGLGTQIFKWAIQRAEEKKCFMIQLTSNKERASAIRFYKNLGFNASHEGFKLIL